MKKKKAAKPILEILFSVLLSVMILGFIIQLLILDKLPMQYLGILVLILLLILWGLVALQLSKKINKNNKTLGKILIVILSLLLGFGNFYLYKTNNTIKNIVQVDPNKIQVSVIVMKDSPVESVEELSGDLGSITVGEKLYIEKALEEVNQVTSLNVVNYSGFDQFGDALYNGEVDAIILNEAFRSQFEENHPTFNADTRVIKTYLYDEEEKEDISVNVDVTEQTFSVYISGIDQRGTINTTGRSDVNKIMTINPKTHQIFILDVPRDYYIPQVCQADQKDKLTHTGIFGVDCSVQSMSNYMGIDINYYVRINFSSLEQIVDALGGVDVYSAYEFDAQGYHFTVGSNYMNGAQALAFSRERYSFAGGDNVRIENQTRVLTAIINKITSPAILTNYLSFMDAISGTFQTNMSESEINSLIKMQVNDMSGWNITSDHLTGTGGSDWTPANGFNAYVMYPDGTSLERALEKIQAIKDGQIIE